MCIRFVYRGREVITGFNFDIDLSEWKHRLQTGPKGLGIGILGADGAYHCFHGVHPNGNAGTLLYVHGDPAGYGEGVGIGELAEAFVAGKTDLDEVYALLQREKLVYAPDATMQAMFSDKAGRALILEPGIGVRMEAGRYALMANDSVFAPEKTRPFALPGDDRMARAKRLLDGYGEDFSVEDAFSLLDATHLEGQYATRVSFVYAAGEGRVYWALNGDFSRVHVHELGGWA